jgi:hypothetical protein
LKSPSFLLQHDVDIDDGRADLAVYRIKDFTREKVTVPLLGQLFRGESYILIYIYRPKLNGDEKCISYFHQGSSSSITEKGTSALMTIELTEQTKLEVQQVRVMEGKESKHLAQLFGGAIITRIGVSETQVGPDLTMCFDVRQIHYGEICNAVESEVKDLAFNSNHAAIILSKSASFIWVGSNSQDCELIHARKVATQFSPSIDVQIIRESNGIPETLGRFLKENGNPYNPSNLYINNASYNPRLFAVSSASGIVTVEEVIQFSQEDLDPNLSFILDAFSVIYVWIGSSSKTVRQMLYNTIGRKGNGHGNCCELPCRIKPACRQEYEDESGLLLPRTIRLHNSVSWMDQD